MLLGKSPKEMGKPWKMIVIFRINRSGCGLSYDHNVFQKKDVSCSDGWNILDTHTSEHTHTSAETHLHKQADQHTHTHTHKHAFTHSYEHAHTNTHTHTRTHTSVIAVIMLCYKKGLWSRSGTSYGQNIIEKETVSCSNRWNIIGLKSHHYLFHLPL